jgi:membrane-bound lytic murein transglycosylase F
MCLFSVEYPSGMKNISIKSKLLIKVSLVFLLVAHACQQSPDFQSSENLATPPVEMDLDAIVKRGQLNVWVDANATSFYIYKGRPMGLEFDMLNQFAEQLGGRLSIHREPDLEKAFFALNTGEADVLAYSLNTNSRRNRQMAFTLPLNKSRQMLVQAKPKNWRKLSEEELDLHLVRNVVALGGKEVAVRSRSAFIPRLEQLSAEIGTPINILRMQGSLSTEALLQQVVKGEISYTIADEHDLHLLADLYPDLDWKTPLSPPQELAWAVRFNAPELLSKLDQYIASSLQNGRYAVLYHRYYKNTYNHAYRVRSSYSSIRGSRISPFDEAIKEAADRLGWDWRVLAAQIYQESKFDTEVESWAGAQGLMQIMPATAARFGANDPFDPVQSMEAGVAYLEYLNSFWKDRILDPNERMKFILASYNAGQGHVLDAYNLTIKYGQNARLWDEVEEFLLKKSDPEYYRDPVVKSGYCRGQEPVNYVREVMERYSYYRQFYS